MTMTIMVNAIAIMQEKNNAIGRDSGMDEANTFAFSSASFEPDADMRSLVEEDLDAIRNLPGVRSAVASNSYPLRQGGWSEGLHLEPDANSTDSIGSAIYLGDNDPVKIVGVIDRLQAPWQSWTGVEPSMLIPQRRLGTYQTYIVRTEPGYRNELMPQVDELLSNSNKGRIIRSMTTMDQVRDYALLHGREFHRQ